MYKRQIYQIAELNRIEKNRFGSENLIESNRNFFARIGMLYFTADAAAVGVFHQRWVEPEKFLSGMNPQIRSE